MINTLIQRANVIRHIRAFFHARDYLEVDTPLLCSHTVTDPHIASLSCIIPSTQQTRFLQTSPEYAMKRLLAKGAGPLFQITKAFRDDDVGRYHNPEFTILEWYRPGFTHHELMQEVDALMQHLFATPKARQTTYHTAFNTHLGINPHTAATTQLQQLAQQHGHYDDAHALCRDDCLTLLFSTVIEPHLGSRVPEFIYDYPASQAALARIRQDDPPVAERFELYYRGHELANGFHELNCPIEQRRRFEAEQQQRQQQQRPIPHIDPHFLNCLTDLPDCAGVAMGIDRLMMLLLDTESIHPTLSFSWNDC